MGAHRAGLGCFAAHVHMAAIAAHPNGLGILGKGLALATVGQQLKIALLVVLLDGGHAHEHLGDGLKALLAGSVGEVLVHLGPLAVFAGGSFHEVVLGLGDAAV